MTIDYRTRQIHYFNGIVSLDYKFDRKMHDNLYEMEKVPFKLKYAIMRQCNVANDN